MKRTTWRLAVAMMLVLSMIGMAGPNAVVAQDTTATLTIHSRFCPENYDMSDVYNTCHDTVGDRGVQFALLGPESLGDIPGTDGSVNFDNLPEGEYWLSTTFPSELHQAYVYCSSNLVPGYRLELSGNDFGGYMVNFSLVAGEAAICDWYTAPNSDFDAERGSITNHIRFCPPGFSDFGSEQQSCLETMGRRYVDFWIDNPLPRDGRALGGNATFSWLIPSDYLVASNAGVPAGVSCSTLDDISTPFLELRIENDESVRIEIQAGVDVICDWYAYPPSDYWVD